MRIREEDKKELQHSMQEIEASGDQDAIKTAREVQDMVSRFEAGDNSALPPTIRAPLDKIKVLEAEAKQLEDNELKPAVENFERAKASSAILSHAGMLAAGGIAAYLSSGMSWLPFLAITGSSAVGGLVAGRVITSNAIEESKRAEGERIFSKMTNLRDQIHAEMAFMNPNNRSDVHEQIEKHFKSQLGIDKPSTSHVANVLKSITTVEPHR